MDEHAEAQAPPAPAGMVPDAHLPTYSELVHAPGWDPDQGPPYEVVIPYTWPYSVRFRVLEQRARRDGTITVQQAQVLEVTMHSGDKPQDWPA
jgi:hypothetical protein